MNPITLIDGTVIADPMNTPPTAMQCLPYQCGADSGNLAALQWCSFFGQAAVYPCSDANCDPVRALLVCNEPGPSPSIPQLTPQNIVQPIPDITAIVVPAPEPPCECSFWCDLNQTISANPLAAVAVLLGAAWLLWPRGN